MSVQNAGAIVREARLKAGLSQEKLSEGICSVLSLSRIENGTAGISPATFEALMAHAGAPCNAYPVFSNRTDFECFYTLKRARFYLNHWQLKEAAEELHIIEELNFANNKYYYQEWLFLWSKLQFRSGCGNHTEIYQALLEAIHLSRPVMDFSDFRDLLLSTIEIELLISIAQEAFYLNKSGICLEICTQISTYLNNSTLSFVEKDRLLAEYAIVYSKYLLAEQDYTTALKLADDFRLKMIKNSDDPWLHELTFLTGLGYYYTGENETALLYFKMVFFSSHSIESCYATTIQHFLSEKLGISLWDSSTAITEIPLVSYAQKKVIDSSGFTDGTYDLFSQETLTLGGLIRELRMEQNLSQQTLCQGLCSKSKLSKIENNTLQPDVTLAQSLLQRLGISDTVFTFYGNKHEAGLQNLRLQLTLTPFSEIDATMKYIEEMQQLCSEKDIVYIQYAVYKKARYSSNHEDHAKNLLQALHLTLPDFDFNNIQNYRFSWLELTILNNYCNAYRKHIPPKGILHLYKLLEYYNTSILDVLNKKRVFGILFSDLSAALYNQKRYVELVELAPYCALPAVRCTLQCLAVFLANYAQALGQLQHTEEIPLSASHAYYNLLITGSTKIAENLKTWIYNDFNSHLF